MVGSSSHNNMLFTLYKTEHICYREQLWVWNLVAEEEHKLTKWRLLQLKPRLNYIIATFIPVNKSQCLTKGKFHLQFTQSHPKSIMGRLWMWVVLKKTSLKKRDLNEGRQCTRMAGSISQRNRDQFDRLYPFPHTWCILVFVSHPTTLFHENYPLSNLPSLPVHNLTVNLLPMCC